MLSVGSLCKMDNARNMANINNDQKVDSPARVTVRTIDLSETLYQPTWVPSTSRPVPLPVKPSIRNMALFKKSQEDYSPKTEALLKFSNGVNLGTIKSLQVEPEIIPQRQHRPSKEPLDIGLEVTKPIISNDNPHTPPRRKLDSAHRRSAHASLQRRRGDRERRTRPWTERASLPNPNDRENITVEVHYGATIPPNTWVKSQPQKFTKNPRWGDRFVLKKVKGKPEQPQVGEWTHDDGFKTWLLEKSGDTKMGINVDKIISSDKENKALNEKAPISKAKGEKSPRISDMLSEKELYQKYLHEKEEREAMDRACIIFQKYVRGWKERVAMQKLQRQAIIEGAGRFRDFQSEFKGLMTRIANRNGVKKKPTFTIEKAIDYLDRKSYYGRIFSEFAVIDHLPVPLLDKFLEKCGLVVNDDTLEYTFNTVFDGCPSRADVVLLNDLPVSLGDGNFRSQQAFLADLIDCLHISPRHVRIGYVPYKSDVFVGFELGSHKSKEAVLKGLEKVRLHKGISRTDIALRTMRNTFKRTRADGAEVKRIAIMISEGGDFQSRALQRQAKEAREKDEIDIYGVLLGTSEKVGEMVSVTGDTARVFRIPHYSAVWGVRAKLMNMAGLSNCRHCSWRPYRMSGLEDGRGLSKTEACELLFQLAPPGSLFNTKKKEIVIGTSRMPMVFNDDDDDLLPEYDGNDCLFNPCLRFVIKSHLDHHDSITLPAGGYVKRDVQMTSWVEAMKRGEEFQEREDVKASAEEEQDRKSGYRKNNVRFDLGDGADDDDADEGTGLNEVTPDEDETDDED